MYWMSESSETGERQLCESVVAVEESNGRSAGATDAYDLASVSLDSTAHSTPAMSVMILRTGKVFLLTDCGTVLIVLSLLQSEPSSTGSRDRRTGDDALTSTQNIMYRDAVHAAYGMEVLS